MYGSQKRRSSKTSSRRKYSSDVKSFLEAARKSFEAKWNSQPSSRSQLADFDLIRTLGIGSFGRVVLAKHRRSGRHFAVKILSKAKLVMKKQVEHTLNEKRVLKSVSCPFLVKLHCHFKDNTNLYLVLEFVNGGEMFTHLRRMRKFSEPHSQFYAAQVVLALEYLHALDLLYRDLKPENILIDRKGYLKIADFGFAKRVKGHTWTVCGTPEYLAPEVFLGKGYGKAVDYWALGILIFEMTTGQTPFVAENSMGIFAKAVAGKFTCPENLTPQMSDLTTNLLQVDLTRRFGNLKNGIEDIKLHSWFSGVDWAKLHSRKLAPPFRPASHGPSDASNFELLAEKPMRISPVDEFAAEFVDF